MRKRPTETHFVPIMDCPCGKKNVPLSTLGPLVKDIDGKRIEINIWHCPFCERIPEYKKEIKGYASLEELKAMGWSEEPDNGEEHIKNEGHETRAG